MNDDIDLDSVLLGASDNPADGSFDPFLPRFNDDDEPGDGRYGATDDPIQQDVATGVIRYGGFGGQGDSGLQPDDDESLPWAGGTDQPTTGADEQRLRAATDAGDRQLEGLPTAVQEALERERLEESDPKVWRVVSPSPSNGSEPSQAFQSPQPTNEQ